MGVVYRAHDTRLSRDVALKVLPAAPSPTRTPASAFARRPSPSRDSPTPTSPPCSTLTPRTTAPTSSSWSSVAGPSLDSRRRKRGPLPEKDVVRLGAQLLHALVAAHEQGILHRDLKPQNVKLTPGGLVKVSSTSVSPASLPALDGSQQGRARRAARWPAPRPTCRPSSFSGKDVDARADVYECGGGALSTWRRGGGRSGKRAGRSSWRGSFNEPILERRARRTRISSRSSSR